MSEPVSDRDLRGELLALASDWHGRSERLLDERCHKVWGDLPMARQRQYGMAVALSVAATSVVSLMGVDPASLWSEPHPKPPRLPEEERAQIVWSDGVER